MRALITNLQTLSNHHLSSSIKYDRAMNRTHTQDRIHEKFMHRETTISREIKLLKNKFELLEKSRQFRSILQKSSAAPAATSLGGDGADDSLALDSSMNDSQRTRSEATSEADSYRDERNQLTAGGILSALSTSSSSAHHPGGAGGRSNKKKSVQIKLSKLNEIGRLIAPLFNIRRSSNRMRRRRSNRVSSIAPTANNAIDGAAGAETTDGDRAVVAGQQQEAASVEGAADGGEATTAADDTARQQAPTKMTKKKRNLFQRILFIR